MNYIDHQNPAMGETLADWLAALGDIPPSRIVFSGHPGPATEDDVLALCNAADKRLCELIDGVLVEKAIGSPESMLASLLLSKLHEFVETHNLGVVLGADGLIRLFAGRIRMPDISIFLWDRVPGDEALNDPIFRFAPNLAVEVLSPSNTVKEMDKKRDDYFSAGVQRVWEVSLPEQCVRVYSSADSCETLTTAEALRGEPVLPGFALPVKALFEKRRRPAG